MYSKKPNRYKKTVLKSDEEKNMKFKSVENKVNPFSLDHYTDE